MFAVRLVMSVSRALTAVPMPDAEVICRFSARMSTVMLVSITAPPVPLESVLSVTDPVFASRAPPLNVMLPTVFASGLVTFVESASTVIESRLFVFVKVIVPDEKITSSSDSRLILFATPAAPVCVILALIVRSSSVELAAPSPFARSVISAPDEMLALTVSGLLAKSSPPSSPKLDVPEIVRAPVL